MIYIICQYLRVFCGLVLTKNGAKPKLTSCSPVSNGGSHTMSKALSLLDSPANLWEGWLGHFLVSVKSRKRSFVVDLYIESWSSCWPFDHFAHSNPFVYYSVLQCIASRHCSLHCRSFPQLVVGSCWLECWLLFLLTAELN